MCEKQTELYVNFKYSLIIFLSLQVSENHPKTENHQSDCEWISVDQFKDLDQPIHSKDLSQKND